MTTGALGSRDLAAIAAALTPPGPGRIAGAASVCSNCEQLIHPGHRITKPPGRAWQHNDCTRIGSRHHQDDNVRRRSVR